MTETICSICIEHITNTNICVTQCNHKFHLSCILKIMNNECEEYSDMFEELSCLSRSSKDDDEITYYTNILILGSGIITFVILNYFS